MVRTLLDNATLDVAGLKRLLAYIFEVCASVIGRVILFMDAIRAFRIV